MANDFICESCNVTANETTNNHEEIISSHDYILFSTGCPKCRILDAKMMEKHLNYEISTDTQKIIDAGFTSAPVLYIVNEKRFLPFAEAVKLINNK